MLNSIRQILYLFLSKSICVIFPKQEMKLKAELLYWKIKKLLEGSLKNSHYRYFYTEYFNLEEDFYKDKKMLDIGCGPRGSLEWAENAKERIGLDPLVGHYTRLGIKNHKMTYIRGYAERIPFPDNYFDVVSSYNSLDHVDDLSRSISEIKRVLAPGGTFLLITNVHIRPTLCEPTTFSYNIAGKFAPELVIISAQHFEGNRVYRSIRERKSYDPKNKTTRDSVVTCRMQKR